MASESKPMDIEEEVPEIEDEVKKPEDEGQVAEREWEYQREPEAQDIEAPDIYGMPAAKVFEKAVIDNLKPQHLLFCGYEKNKFKHVFLLGRYLDGRIMYIDPQVGKNGTVCDIHQAECYKYISGAQKYYILHYNPTKKLTKKRIKEMNISTK